MKRLKQSIKKLLLISLVVGTSLSSCRATTNNNSQQGGIRGEVVTRVGEVVKGAIRGAIRGAVVGGKVGAVAVGAIGALLEVSEPKGIGILVAAIGGAIVGAIAGAIIFGVLGGLLEGVVVGTGVRGLLGAGGGSIDSA